MAEVLNMPLDNLDQPRHSEEPPNDKQSEDPNSSSPPPPSSQPPPQQPQQQHPKRRDRDSGERRDDRENDRPFNRRGGGGGGGGLYSDHNRSPPQLLPRDREYRDNRDRDYKRRNSMSPPPPYRDRRRTPPRRSPPFAPYNKRSRRDDGGYDGRRGSPRGGGFWHGERRFGYDHGNGYEREMGGRPQFGDERPHGRYGGRSGGYQNGPPDWDYGRGGYNDASSTGASQREGLMSYKQFIQELEDDILPAEAERRYQEYKSEYISTQKRVFFDAHKNEEWLKDKYHPTNLLTVIERRNELARKSAKDFLLDLQNASLDLGPGVNATASSKPSHTSDPNSDDDVDAGGKRRRPGRGLAKDFNLASSAPKAHPICSESRRIHIDVEQAQALVRKLDSEKGIEGNILGGTDSEKLGREKSHSSAGPVVIVRGLNAVKGLEGLELLDTLMTYLWRVHGLDYYGMTETCEAKGLRHVRAEGKISNAINGTEWENKFDLRWRERLSGQDPLEIMTAKERIEAAAVEGLDPFVRKIRDEKYGWKYGCGAKGCTKLFHASEFVHKHLKLKHPEIVIDLTSQLREDLYFQNYMQDSDAPGGKPVMQQSLPKDRLQRRRPGDARENMRNRDDRGSEKYDRAENLQSLDFQSKNDGPEGANADQAMFDSFGAPAFGSDIAPPPVLMPVPGAGPLGPFVPAPPEVAMRMLREQGGPPPFEAGTRNGMPGPHLGGSAPLIALPHAFRQDPRRLRSYQDLDAPEDEVTVIDYRSL